MHQITDSCFPRTEAGGKSVRGLAAVVGLSRLIAVAGLAGLLLAGSASAQSRGGVWALAAMADLLDIRDSLVIPASLVTLASFPIAASSPTVRSFPIAPFFPIARLSTTGSFSGE